MVSHLKSLGILGMDAFVVDVEADLSNGIPAFDIVGLPDVSVKEARDRVRSALKNCGFDFPVRRITINLAPADVKKAGPTYDLPVLLSILKATGQLEIDTDDSAFIGEISLSGDVRSINGVLPMVIKAMESGIKNIYVPKANAAEGAVVTGINVYPIDNLINLFKHLTKQETISPAQPIKKKRSTCFSSLDYSQVKGQYEAKRALEIAAAGGHNIMLIGPPGSGKSMLAKRLPSILPDMTFDEQIETTKIHSVAGTLHPDVSLIDQRPFRSPHHTVSPAGLSGGGTTPRPGEISLAHNGVLFLDELPEFARISMEVLRQPIEDGIVTISRVSGSLSYPCSVMLVAAMNPCPCGYFGHPTKVCNCSPKVVSKYLSRVSGPLLDRLDIHVEVPAIKFDELSSKDNAEGSKEIKNRINKVRKIQQERYKDTKITCNARITSDLFHKTCSMTDQAQNLLKLAFDKMGLSARAYDRILKVARTIADMDNSDTIDSTHISEAVQYRSLDRKYWLRES